ncbi:MAG: metallophosphoesterase [Clostridia bacterium]|nr:metallophosphoesterase [Clostridia bacterium]
MRITTYKLNTPKLPRSLRIALVADLHNRPFDGMLDAVTRISPDLICIAGDLIEALDGTMDEKNASGFAALEALCKIAPTFYAPGNHEVGASHRHLRKYPPVPDQVRITPENMARIKQSGACFLHNTHTEWQGIAIGGLGTGLLNASGLPDTDALDAFFAHDGYRILLCHHPEYYAKCLRDKDVDLVLSGHAHGGQWRIFGRGIFAPDQGIFPKYTAGMHEGRLIISRGTANTGGIVPRLFNPCEVVCIQIN